MIVIFGICQGKNKKKRATPNLFLYATSTSLSNKSLFFFKIALIPNNFTSSFCGQKANWLPYKLLRCLANHNHCKWVMLLQQLCVHKTTQLFCAIDFKKCSADWWHTCLVVFSWVELRQRWYLLTCLNLTVYFNFCWKYYCRGKLNSADIWNLEWF